MKNRPSTDAVLMSNAMQWAERSTCARAQVGCVISRESRVLSTGYNGAPAGMDHCSHVCSCQPQGFEAQPGYPFKHYPHCQSLKPCTEAIHAEANAIAFAAKYGVTTNGATIHTTRVPCLSCAGLIINAGVIRVVWMEPHREMTGWERLAAAGLEVVEWSHGA